MTALRLISLPTHAALELALGLVVMAAPLALGATPAGLVVSVALGALIVGLALSAASGDVRSLGVSTHFAFDRGIAIGLLGGALVLAIAGDLAASLTLAVAAMAQSLLNVTTRYTARA